MMFNSTLVERAMSEAPDLMIKLTILGSVVCAAVLSGCADASGGRDTVSRSQGAAAVTDTTIFAFSAMPSDSVQQVTLPRIGGVRLGSDSGSTPARVGRIAFHGDRILVIDGAIDGIRAYDRSGAPLFTITPDADGASRFRDPRGLAVLGDTLFIVDMTPAVGLAAFDMEGRHLRTRSLDIESSIVDLAPARGHLAVATIMRDEDLRGGAANVVRVVSTDGTVVAGGCPSDPIYSESVRRAGLLQLFRGTGVSASGGVIYCRQPLSPVIQLLGEDGRRAGVVAIAPPFYARTADVPETLNQVTIDHFRTRWTEHSQFYPLESGFVSIYTSYDVEAGANVYRVFTCDTTGLRRRCATAIAPGKPAGLLAPDTLVVQEPLSERQSIRVLGFYRIRRP